MREAWLAAKLVLLPTAAVAVALAVAPDRAALEIHVWLLVVLALACIVLVRAVHRAYPTGNSPFLASLRIATLQAERPNSLARTERELSMAGAAAFDVHFRLRPVLAELAADLLSTRRGIDLDRSPERAHVALGDEVWEIVRPGRPEPAERHAPGLDEAQLDRIVTALEHL
jgi:hypothetical protein